MGRTTISALSIDGRRLQSRKAPQRRFLLTAVILSVGAHVAAALLIVLLPRVLPREARPQEQGTVELLMVEKKGADPSPENKAQDGPPTPPQPEKQPEAPKVAAANPEPPAPAPEPVTRPDTQSDEAPALPPVKPTSPQAAKTKAQPDTPPPDPTPRAPPEPLQFNLAGTDSESNAQALGDHIIPASPDNRFRNRPPIYPYEAAIHGEHGVVLLLIHVSEAGVATSVDVVESSGVASLDQAASAAVRKWRFRPALQEGRAVPFDMPFRFVFQAD